MRSEAFCTSAWTRRSFSSATRPRASAFSIRPRRSRANTTSSPASGSTSRTAARLRSGDRREHADRREQDVDEIDPGHRPQLGTDAHPEPTRRRIAVRAKSIGDLRRERAGEDRGDGPRGPRRRGVGRRRASARSRTTRRPRRARRPAAAGRRAQRRRAHERRAPRRRRAARTRAAEHEHRQQHELHGRRPALGDIELHRQHHDEQAPSTTAAPARTPADGRRHRDAAATATNPATMVSSVASSRHPYGGGAGSAAGRRSPAARRARAPRTGPRARAVL